MFVNISFLMRNVAFLNNNNNNNNKNSHIILLTIENKNLYYNF